MENNEFMENGNRRERRRKNRKPINSANSREFKENENPSDERVRPSISQKHPKRFDWVDSVDEVEEFVPIYNDDDEFNKSGDLRQISLVNDEESWAESRNSGDKRNQSKRKSSLYGAAKNTWTNSLDQENDTTNERRAGAEKQKYGMTALVTGKFGELFITLDKEEIQWHEVNSNKIQNRVPYSLVLNARKRRKFERICVNYVEECDQILKEESIEFDFSDTGSAKKWIRHINRLAGCKSRRPKRIRIYVASKDGMHNVETLALPLLESYEVTHTLISVIEKSDIFLDVKDLNFDEFDALVMVGGDEAVHTLISCVLNRNQSESFNNKRLQFNPSVAKIPIGIWPSGLHNDIAFSIMGNVDFKTSVLHLLLGHRMTPDISSVHQHEKLLDWSFNSQYGFGSTVQKNFLCTKGNNERKHEASICKSLGKSQFIPYDCNIEFLIDIQSEDQNEDPSLVNICSRGCSVCEEAKSKRDADKEAQSNQIHELSSVADVSDTDEKDSVIELDSLSKWVSIKGQFIWVGVYTIPCRSDLAVQGMSKNCHLEDGTMDLILVKDCTRKEFLQFFRRLGNKKNQTDLPFVEYHRVKSVRFRPRMGITWQHRNTNKTEIDYQMQDCSPTGAFSSATSSYRRPSFIETISLSETNSIELPRENSFNEIEVIDDQLTDDSESENEDQPQTNSNFLRKPPSCSSSPFKGRRDSRSSPITFVVDNLCDDECSLDDYNIVRSAEYHSNSSLRGSTTDLNKPLHSGMRRLSVSLGTTKSTKSVPGKPPISASSGKKGKIKEKMKAFRRIFKTTEAGSLPEPDYIRPSTTPAERAAQKKLVKENYRENKLRIKMEEKSTSSWMLDYNIIDEKEIQICIHSGLIEIFGKGILKGSKIPENKMLWLSMVG